MVFIRHKIKGCKKVYGYVTKDGGSASGQDSGNPEPSKELKV